MEMMGTRAASELWGCKPERITALCRAGRIPGAVQDKPGSPWRIPVDTLNPILAEKERKAEKKK